MRVFYFRGGLLRFSAGANLTFGATAMAGQDELRIACMMLAALAAFILLIFMLCGFNISMEFVPNAGICSMLAAFLPLIGTRSALFLALIFLPASAFSRVISSIFWELLQHDKIKHDNQLHPQLYNRAHHINAFALHQTNAFHRAIVLVEW